MLYLISFAAFYILGSYVAYGAFNALTFNECRSLKMDPMPVNMWSVDRTVTIGALVLIFGSWLGAATITILNVAYILEGDYATDPIIWMDESSWENV